MQGLFLTIALILATLMVFADDDDTFCRLRNSLKGRMVMCMDQLQYRPITSKKGMEYHFLMGQYVAYHDILEILENDEDENHKCKADLH
jgi:hypothetical protein